MNNYAKLVTYNFLSIEDLLFKVALFSKQSRDVVRDNCWGGIMADGIEERTLRIE